MPNTKHMKLHFNQATKRRRERRALRLDIGAMLAIAGMVAIIVYSTLHNI